MPTQAPVVAELRIIVQIPAVHMVGKILPALAVTITILNLIIAERLVMLVKTAPIPAVTMDGHLLTVLANMVMRKKIKFATHNVINVTLAPQKNVRGTT